MNVAWECCRVNFMRGNTLTLASRSSKRMISGFDAKAFAQEDAKSVEGEWRRVAY